MPQSTQYTVVTPLQVHQVKQIFHGFVSARSRRATFEPMPASSNPFEEVETFSAVASTRGHTGGWMVQIYIYDRGPVREVVLVAVGSGILGTAWVGLRKASLLRKSRAVAEGVLQQLPEIDPMTKGQYPGDRMG